MGSTFFNFDLLSKLWAVKVAILGGFAVRFSHIKHKSFELKLWLCTECVKPKKKSEADFWVSLYVDRNKA